PEDGDPEPAANRRGHGRMLPPEEEGGETRREIGNRQEEDGGIDESGQPAEQARDVRGGAEDHDPGIRGAEPVMRATEHLRKESVEGHRVGKPRGSDRPRFAVPRKGKESADATDDRDDGGD